MTRAIRIHRTGGPDVLQVEDVDVPPPLAGQVRVKHTYVGLNFIDVYHRTGLYPQSLPCVLGEEAAGRIAALGPGVTGFAVGDRVAYARGFGAWCDERNLEAEKLVKLPPNVSDELAASVMLKGMTAEYLVRRTFQVKRGDVVLFHAAAGGVGVLACQWARSLGARVIGTVSTPEKAAFARQYCDEVIVTKQRNFVTDVKAMTQGVGCDVVYDSIGQTTFEGSLSCLKPRGMLVSFGQSSGKIAPLDIGRLGGERSLFVTRPSLAAYAGNRKDLEQSSAALFEVLSKNIVRVPPPKKYKLEQAAQAMQMLEARRTMGATVLEVDAELAATMPAAAEGAAPAKKSGKAKAAAKPEKKKPAAKAKKKK